MRVIIVDDESAPAEKIKKLLSIHFPKFTLCGVYNKVSEAIEGINQLRPDLVFLDVELDEGQTGFDLLEKITPRFFEVIFVTAYNKFAVRAFQYSALHFIQKPIDEMFFTQAVNRAIETKATKDFNSRFDSLLEGMHSEQLPQKLMVPNLKGEGWLCLNISQVVRVVSDGKQMVKITYEEKDKYLFTGVSKSIGEAEKMLEGHDFIRVHESSIVNMKYVESIKQNKKTLVMCDKEEIEVSRSNVSLLMKKMRKL